LEKSPDQHVKEQDCFGDREVEPKSDAEE